MNCTVFDETKEVDLLNEKWDFILHSVKDFEVILFIEDVRWTFLYRECRGQNTKQIAYFFTSRIMFFVTEYLLDLYK